MHESSCAFLFWRSETIFRRNPKENLSFVQNKSAVTFNQQHIYIFGYMFFIGSLVKIFSFFVSACYLA